MSFSTGKVWMFDDTFAVEPETWVPLIDTPVYQPDLGRKLALDENMRRTWSGWPETSRGKSLFDPTKGCEPGTRGMVYGFAHAGTTECTRPSS